MREYEQNDTLARLSPSPQPAAGEKSPWKGAMDRVLIGMVLSTITLDLFWLNYILPALGTVLLLLGLRRLRRENPGFERCYTVTVIQAACLFTSLVLNTTILSSAAMASPVLSALSIVDMTLPFLFAVFLRQGLLQARERAACPASSGGGTALVVWHGLLFFLALLPAGEELLFLAMLLAYAFILRSLFRLSKALDQQGLPLQPASVRLTDRALVCALSACLVAGGALGYLFGGSYPMTWQAVDPAGHGSVAATKEQLAALGFPQHILNDLTPEDIAACQGASQVVVTARDESLQGGGSPQQLQKAASQGRPLRITGVAVEIPGDQDRWVLFHHFLWTADPGFYGTESIQLQPTYGDLTGGNDTWLADGSVTGRVLYDQGGETFSADYYTLGEQTYTSDNFLFGGEVNTDIFAAFSLPKQGENHRAYLSYPVKQLREHYALNSIVSYTHQNSWLQYPAVTAMEKKLSMEPTYRGAFRNIFSSLQFHPADESVAAAP